MFSHVCFSNFHLLIQKQTWEKKQMKKKSEKKKFLLHPWKSTWNLTIHLFWVPAIHFPGCTLPFTSDRCRPLLRYYAIMLLCYYAMVGVWVDDLNIYWNGAVVYFFKPVYVFISCWKFYVVPTDEFIFQILIMCHYFRMFFLIYAVKFGLNTVFKTKFVIIFLCWRTPFWLKSILATPYINLL